MFIETYLYQFILILSVNYFSLCTDRHRRTHRDRKKTILASFSITGAQYNNRLYDSSDTSTASWQKKNNRFQHCFTWKSGPVFNIIDNQLRIACLPGGLHRSGPPAISRNSNTITLAATRRYYFYFPAGDVTSLLPDVGLRR